MARLIPKNGVDMLKVRAYLPAAFTLEGLSSAFDEEIPEKVAVELHNLIKVVRDRQSEDLFVYNYKEGYYEPLPDWKLQGIYKYVLKQAVIVWDSRTEGEVLKAFERDVTIIVEEFNGVNALNLANGVLELDTMVFRGRDPNKDFFTNVLSYSYEKEAPCPLFEKFMKEVTCGEEALQLLLQEIIGYTLSVRVDAEKAFFFYGGGCNGKSVLAGILNTLVGEENTCAISSDSFGGTFALAGCIGKKLNISGENERITNVERLKSLISADKMNIPIKYQKDWVGVLHTKHIFLMNALPETTDVSHGFMRKIVIVPFNYRVPEEQIDCNLGIKLRGELPGILNYAMDGYQRLKRNHFVFTACASTETILSAYKERENPTGTFFRETFERCEGASIVKSELYRHYEHWCRTNDFKLLNRMKFFDALKVVASEPDSDIELNYTKRQGIRYLVGYRLRQVPPKVEHGSNLFKANGEKAQ